MSDVSDGERAIASGVTVCKRMARNPRTHGDFRTCTMHDSSAQCLPSPSTPIGRSAVVHTVRERMPYFPFSEFPEPMPAVRGVYCLREPINGLWAYYSVTDRGELLHEPRPADLGTETAWVVTALFDELDLLNPVVEPVEDRPRLTVIRSHASGAA